jgi:hypothetical protein
LGSQHAGPEVMGVSIFSEKDRRILSNNLKDFSARTSVQSQIDLIQMPAGNFTAVEETV